MSDTEIVKDSEIQKLEELITTLLNKFSELKKERDNLLQTVEKREETIGEREGIIAERDATIIEQKETIEERELTIIERDEAIEALQAKLNDKDSERSQFSEKVSSIMDQITSWEQSLDMSNNDSNTETTSSNYRQDMF